MLILSNEELLSLCAVALIGLPHGALDAAVLFQYHWRSSRSLLTVFSTYIIIVLVTLGVWWSSPLVGLISFFILSAMHFGFGDIEGLNRSHYKRMWSDLLDAFFLGALTLSVLILSDTERVMQIFDVLMGTQSYIETSILEDTLWIVITFFSLWLFITRGRSKVIQYWKKRVTDLLTLGAMSYFTNPITAFAFYFCGFHSVRHLYTVFKNMREDTHATFLIKMIVSFSIITWIIGAIYLFSTPQQQSLDEAYLRLIFIGLSALTTPHILLMDYWYWGSLNNVAQELSA